MPRIGIIAGSGFYDVDGIELKTTEALSTPFGEPSDRYRTLLWNGLEVVFLPRHGSPHRIAPHRVNYRANLWGFQRLGVEQVFAVNAVGGINRELAPGSIVIPDQIIDMTHGRPSTFYEGDDVVHIDFTDPYCPSLRQALGVASAQSGIATTTGGTYICVNGPRLESRAEIRLFAKMDADVVGMTAMPEAALARELEICFACIAVVTNPAAGISAVRLTTDEVIATMQGATDRIRSLLGTVLRNMPAERERCGCASALSRAKI